MRYRVAASIVQERIPELARELTDGSIQGQEPDGNEIVASMRRARVTPSGRIEWYETCYCPTPLAHERATVYDRFFLDMSIEEVTSEPALEGRSFWTELEASIQGEGS